MNIVEGLLVGRLSKNKSVYLWSIIPNNYEGVDVLETSAPPQDDIYVTLNKKRIRKYLRFFVVVKAVRRDVVGPTGSISFGDIKEISAKLPVAEDSIKSLDNKGSIHTVEYDEINDAFLVDISNLLGGGIRHIKRFYSLQVAVNIEGLTSERILVPLQEMFLYIMENPGEVTKIAVLPSYHFAVIFLENPIPQEIFRDVVVAQATRSATTYMNFVDRATIMMSAENE